MYRHNTVLLVQFVKLHLEIIIDWVYLEIKNCRLRFGEVGEGSGCPLNEAYVKPVNVAALTYLECVRARLWICRQTRLHLTKLIKTFHGFLFSGVHSKITVVLSSTTRRLLCSTNLQVEI